MGFKKININNKKNKNLINIIGIISISIIFVIGFFTIKNINFIQVKIDENNKILNNSDENIENELNLEKIEEIKENQNKEKTNILLIGRGGGNHDAPNLTDVIILASINDIDNNINLLSIPRDLFVDYPGDDNEEGKINGIYAHYFGKTGDKEKAIGLLKEKIKEITGEKIDYYANIDFKGFEEVIDTIGGITLTLESNFQDNEYPDGNWGYTTLFFKKGTWLFDGENTLKYVRSRHSTSDFDRSMRQQQVLTAIKNKLTGVYFLKSPGKIKELYDVMKKNIETDIPLTEILSIVYKIKSSADYEINSSNINDTCFYGSVTCSKGGFLYVPARDFFDGMSVLLLEGNEKGDLNNFKYSKLFSDIVFNNSKLFEENYELNIFNSLKINHLAGTLSNDVIRYGFNIPAINSIGNTQDKYEKSIIYYNNIDENSTTIKVLRQFFDGDFIKTDTPKYSKSGAKIEIIIGEDYLDSEVFKF